MSKQDQTNLQLREAQATPELKANPRFVEWVRRSLEAASEAQKHYLNQRLGEMSKGEFISMIRDDTDYPADTTDPKIFEHDTHAYFREFEEAIQTATTIDSLINVCRAYIDAEHYILFFQTNDVVAARTKQDYFNAFLDQLLPRLEEDGLLDEAAKDIFGHLKHAYALGLDAYNIARIDVAQISGDKYRGLLHMAHNNIKRQLKPQGDIAALGMAIETGAMEQARGILRDFYDLDLPEDVEVPPLIFALVHRLRSLATLEMQEQHPRLDIQDPKTDLCAEFEAIHGRLLTQVIAPLQEENKTENYAKIVAGIEEKIRLKDNIPNGFGEMIDKAARKAARTVFAKTEDYASQDRDRYKLYEQEGLGTESTGKPRCYTVLDDILPMHDNHRRLGFEMRAMLAEAGKLHHAYCKEDLIARLNDFSSVAIDESVFGWNHPAILVATRDFIAQFRRNLGQAMHDASKAGQHYFDAKFLHRIEEVEQAIGYAYQSRNQAGKWLMQATQGGCDHFFDAAWLQRGWDIRKLSGPEDMKELKEEARDKLCFLAEEREIPEAIVTHPFAPLIYERCLDVAEAELEKELETKLQAARERGEPMGTRSFAGSLGKRYAYISTRDPKFTEKISAKWGGERSRNHRPADYMEAASPSAEEADFGIPESTSKVYQHMHSKVAQKNALKVMSDALARITLVQPDATQEQRAEADPEDDSLKPMMTAHNVCLLFDYLDARERAADMQPQRGTGIH